MSDQLNIILLNTGYGSHYLKPELLTSQDIKNLSFISKNYNKNINLFYERLLKEEFPNLINIKTPKINDRFSSWIDLYFNFRFCKLPKEILDCIDLNISLNNSEAIHLISPNPLLYKNKHQFSISNFSFSNYYEIKPYIRLEIIPEIKLVRSILNEGCHELDLFRSNCWKYLTSMINTLTCTCERYDFLIDDCSLCSYDNNNLRNSCLLCCHEVDYEDKKECYNFYYKNYKNLIFEQELVKNELVRTFMDKTTKLNFSCKCNESEKQFCRCDYKDLYAKEGFYPINYKKFRELVKILYKDQTSINF